MGIMIYSILGQAGLLILILFDITERIYRFQGETAYGAAGQVILRTFVYVMIKQLKL